MANHDHTNIVHRTRADTSNLRAKLDHISSLLNENLPGSFDAWSSTARQTYQPYKFAKQEEQPASAESAPESSHCSPQGDPKAPTESPSIRHMLRRPAPPSAQRKDAPLPRQRKMFPNENQSGASVKQIASPDVGDPARKTFRTASRNASSGLVPSLDFSALACEDPPVAHTEAKHVEVHSVRNHESSEFKAAISGEAAVGDASSCVSQRTPGRVLPEKVWQPLRHSAHTARPQSGSLGANFVPLGAEAACSGASPPPAPRQATLIVPGLREEEHRAPAQQRYTHAHTGSAQCPWAPSAEPAQAPAAPATSVACAALPLSRTFATYTDGPRQVNTARYGRHLAKQEAQEHHVRLSAANGGLRTAQWSRRYVAPGNPLFTHLRFPLDASLVKAPKSEYAKAFARKTCTKSHS